MRRVIYVVITAILLAGCTTVKRVHTDNWEDATLVAELRAELAQLKRDHADMGQSIGEVSDGIDRLTERLSDGIARGLERGATVQELFDEIDQFVRELIGENTKLREFSRSDRGADAGEG